VKRKYIDADVIFTQICDSLRAVNPIYFIFGQDNLLKTLMIKNKLKRIDGAKRLACIINLSRGKYRYILLRFFCLFTRQSVSSSIWYDVWTTRKFFVVSTIDWIRHMVNKSKRERD